MIGRALRVAAVLMVSLGLVAACGSSDRPRELSMGDVKPCDLISQSSFQQIQVSTESQKLDSVPGVDTEGNTCFYRLRTGNTVYVSAITNHGIDRWTNSSFEDARSQDIPRVQGFRAIKVWFDSDRPDPDHKCRIYVDVAGGQSLRVEVGETVNEEDPPTCDTARRFAEAAMKSLAH
ncbi:hypothetical protein FHX42_003699 [Saccharopolyspora lacisalsi]|uniref:DUF3558 domain-containing protein n=1 Tax=Halosaccharopolyspora lacisalsi TaxID=1000566 RepID=A0A839DZ95_9PSEU|nr:DUF3558 family protein [Halosaccharopolyspora lacisalsi]MBA8826323.1 hypothetical protein [Halosaccharopolyspora lacisalsi]